jgi:PBP1b-binding outer membrane lipoprotein LpoB
MEFKNNKLVSVVLVLFAALFLTGCSETLNENPHMDELDIQAVEVTSDDIIEDVVVEDVEEDVELGELI